MTTELYRKLRPSKLDQVIGQPVIVKALAAKLENQTLSHVILFSGPSGSGKTTLAKIIAHELDAVDRFSLREINCAEVRGIDSVRDIQDQIRVPPMIGNFIVYILDEVVQLPKTTQQAFLKVLEDPPDYVYFLLCATEISGLLDTFLTRCSHMILQPLEDQSICRILVNAQKAEGKKITVEVENAIIKKSQGNARKALQILEQVLTSSDPSEQFQILNISTMEDEEKVEFLAKLLLSKANWQTAARAIKDIQEKDLEGLRRKMLAYMGIVLLNARGTPNGDKAAHCIDVLQFDWANSGKAGLVLALDKCLRGPG